MTVLEFFAATAGTGIVRARHLLTDDGLAMLLSALASVLLCSLLLCALDLVDVVFLLLIALSVLLGRSLLHLLALHLHRNLTTHEEAGHAGVHIVDHRIPELGTLEFEDQQWILLLVGRVLHAMAQLVELTEVFLPVIIDDVDLRVARELDADAGVGEVKPVVGIVYGRIEAFVVVVYGTLGLGADEVVGVKYARGGLPVKVAVFYAVDVAVVLLGEVVKGDGEVSSCAELETGMGDYLAVLQHAEAVYAVGADMVRLGQALAEGQQQGGKQQDDAERRAEAA